MDNCGKTDDALLGTPDQLVAQSKKDTLKINAQAVKLVQATFDHPIFM